MSGVLVEKCGHESPASKRQTSWNFKTDGIETYIDTDCGENLYRENLPVQDHEDCGSLCLEMNGEKV